MSPAHAVVLLFSHSLYITGLLGGTLVIVDTNRICGNMVSSLKMTPWLMAIFCLVTAGCSNITDQQTSESQQRDQVAILKQLRKVNDDGSYSFGYEAGDGSFKVESRDVLGNVKGTFGFVDATGEIKRVTYSSSNGTGFKSTTVSPFQEHVSVVQSIPRVNRTSTSSTPTSSSTTTSTTRRPTSSSLVYASSPKSTSSSSSFVQAIPRHQSRKSLISSSTTSSTPTTSTLASSTTTTKSRPRFLLNSQHHRRRLIQEEDDSIEDHKQRDINTEEQQITRPTRTDEKLATYRRILFSNNKRPLNLRPITEEFEEKDEEEVKITTGNTLMRRQLDDDTTKSIETIPNDEQSDVYGSGSLSTTRPLFTTSPPSTLTQHPRLIHRRIPIFRGSLLGQQSKQNYESNQQQGRFYEVEETKVMDDEREPPREILVRGPMLRRIPAGNVVNDNYHVDQDHQREQPIYVQRSPELYQRNVYSVMNDDEPRNVFIPQRRPMYTSTSTEDTNVNYNTEPPVTESVSSPERPTILRASSPVGYREDDYPIKSNRIALLPPLSPMLTLPLSRRDFQLLLRRLIVSQYVGPMEAPIVYPRKTYHQETDEAIYNRPYWPYQPTAGMTMRQGLLYDRAQPVVDDRQHYNPYYNNPRGLHNIPPRRYEDDYERDINEYPVKRVYRRQKFYPQDIVNDDDEGYDDILPAHIREALLLRMLQLAIGPERHSVNSGAATTTLIPPSSTAIYRKNGPIRSVQIINDEENISMPNKN